MSSSSWPPELKAWVQDCLSRANPTNKPAVNAELKQILLQAHRDGTINSTDWSKVQLQSLQAQAIRTTYTPPAPSYPAPPPPPPSSSSSSYSYYPSTSNQPPPSPSLSIASSADTNGLGKGKNKKRKKENSFPSAYTFVSAEEEEAKARRAARFQKSSTTPSSSSTPSAVGYWFENDDGTPVSAGSTSLGSRISGLALGSSATIPGQVGKKKLKGKMGLGYGEDVIEVDPNVIDWDKHTIRGTSTKLEKPYLRLTSEPSPADIRPLPVLRQTLQLLKDKWKANHNYAYALDQFKSLRQDLTVQRIKNEFTVEVYEIHARIALEAKDLGEYNQCQSMLRQLYELGIKGHPQEFLSYRIMYLLHTRNRSDMAALLAQLTPTEKNDPGVHHALQVHAALATSNYVKLFRLFLQAPNMSGYIMDHFVERERSSALAVMSKAYLTLPLPYITQVLAFEDDEQAHTFLNDQSSAIYTNSPVQLPPRDPKNPWKSQHSRPKDLPFAERIWDCKKAHPAAAKAVEKYRVVDLKGQVD